MLMEVPTKIEIQGISIRNESFVICTVFLWDQKQQQVKTIQEF